jgi:predicted metal-binding protein
MEDQVARKIVETVPDGILQQDLEKYRQRAVELGADDAKIITSDMIIIDERVRAKCIYPKCEYYGTCANCPPYAIELEQTRKLVNRFRYAIFFRLKLPIETISGKRTPEQLKETLRLAKVRREIVAKIESEAFYDSYYLAVGFGGGSCKRYFCPDEDCRALKLGQSCRFPLRARSSMEAVGMDVYRMATQAGWDIYPIGGKQSDAPYGTFTGIVLIY